MNLLRIKLFTIAGLVFLGELLLTSCTSNKSPPASPLVLNVVARVSVAEVTLHTVIVPGGPNAWTKDALWDEYMVTITNRSSAPLTLESATIEDVLHQPRRCGGDPLKLARSTVENWKEYRKGQVPVTKEGFETTVPAAVAIPLATAAIVMNPLNLILLPFALADEESIKKEFANRQLVLPLILPSGSSAMGSIFFPMAAAPKNFALQGQCEGKPVEIVIPLTPLDQLHLTAAR